METTQYRMVFPHVLNDMGTLFGGTAMSWMDETAYITAIRYSRQRMVTVTVENVKFLHPVKSGNIAEITARIIKVKTATLLVLTEIYVEECRTGAKTKAVEAMFTFASVDESNQPVRLICRHEAVAV